MKYCSYVKKLALPAVMGLLFLGSACQSSIVQGWSGPTVDDGIVYIGTMQGKLSAYDSANGDPKWQKALQVPAQGGFNFGCAPGAGAKPLTFYSNATTDSSSVFIGSYDATGGIVYAVNKATGEIKWQFPRTDRVGPIVGSIAVSQGMVYFGSSDGKLYALAAANGLEQWTYSTGNKIWDTPAVVDNRVYFGSFDNNLYALNASDGSLVWKFETEGAITADPLVVNGTVYIGSLDKHLYAVDAASGKARWSFLADGWFWSAPALSGSTLIAGNLDGKVYALDAASGSQLWKYETKGAIRPSPAVTGDIVVVGSEDKNLYYLKASTGVFIRATPIGVPVLSSLTIQKGLVYAYTGQGLLIAFNAETGTRVWEVSTNG